MSEDVDLTTNPNPPVQANPYSAPDSEIIPKADRHNMMIFERFSAWFVFLLSIVTMGIYSVYWVYTRSKTYNTKMTDQISDTFIISALVLYCASFVMSYLPYFIDGSEDFELMILSASFTSGVVNIVWFFMLRRRIQDMLSSSNHLGLHLSAFMTFFFNAIYLQYKINEAIDVSGQIYDYQETLKEEVVVDDSELLIGGIDYSKYSKSELEDCLQNIDEFQYPERVKVIKLAMTRYN